MKRLLVVVDMQRDFISTEPGNQRSPGNCAGSTG